VALQFRAGRRYHSIRHTPTATLSVYRASAYAEATPRAVVDTESFFYLIATTLIAVDPGFMSSDMPPMDVSAVMDMVMEVGFVQHMMPGSFWKAMRWVNIGPERKLDMAHKVLRGFVFRVA
jgi:hypothetical protein